MEVEQEVEEVKLDIKLGDQFKNIDEFAAKLNITSKNNFVQYYRRDSRTVENAIKSNRIKRYLNPDLQIYQCKYNCIHGGREHIPTGTGKRRTKTFRNENLCAAYINVSATKSGNELEVVEINNLHNHKIDKTLFAQLPQQRRLPPELKEEAKRLLRLKANKRMIREELETKSNKFIKLKDLINLAQEDRQHSLREQYMNSIESAVDKIHKKFGPDCHFLNDSNDQFKGLLLCTPIMKAAVQAYPEILCIDATYKLSNIRTPVYLIFIEDGNGESQVVCAGILVDEDKESLQWFLTKFIEINPACKNTLHVMADKNWNESDVLKESFPQAKLLICIFHVFKICHQETIRNKIITNIERKLALQSLQDMVYAKSEDEFNKIKNEIEKSLSNTIVAYLEKHWINIHEEWCPLLGLKISNFINHTNNRVECIDAKLKSVITIQSSFEELFDKFFIILQSLERERMHQLAERINKSVNKFKPGTPEYYYSKYASEYAFKKILLQLKSMSRVQILSNEGDIFIIKSSHGEDVLYNTTTDSCSCYFFNSMGLPCKHIFAVLKELGNDLFNENLVKPRWSQEYIILNNQMSFETFTDSEIIEDFPELSSDVFDTSITDKKKTKALSKKKTKVLSQRKTKVSSKKHTNALGEALSQQDKYSILNSKCKLIATLGVEATGQRFEDILNSLDTFSSLLKQNRDIFVGPRPTCNVNYGDPNEEIQVDNVINGEAHKETKDTEEIQEENVIEDQSLHWFHFEC